MSLCDYTNPPLCTLQMLVDDPYTHHSSLHFAAARHRLLTFSIHFFTTHGAVHSDHARPFFPFMLSCWRETQRQGFPFPRKDETCYFGVAFGVPCPCEPIRTQNAVSCPSLDPSQLLCWSYTSEGQPTLRSELLTPFLCNNSERLDLSLFHFIYLGRACSFS